MLDGVRILAWGKRRAVELSATLLERAGAQVTVARAQPSGDVTHDVIIVPSDLCVPSERNAIAELKAAGRHIVCDITATGPQGTRAGLRASVRLTVAARMVSKPRTMSAR